MGLSAKELLKHHMDCLYTYANGRMVLVNEPWGSTQSAPRLMVGRTVQGELFWRLGQRADSVFTEQAEKLLSQGIFEASAYETQLRAQCVEQWSCFYYPHSEVPPFDSRLLSAADAALLSQSFSAGFEDCREELRTAQPFAVSFCNGKIVSICRSVRKGLGHEAGIKTLAPFRRQGYAGSALRCWTAAMLGQGNIPLYSASIDNRASIQPAQKNGYVLYAITFSLD